MATLAGLGGAVCLYLSAPAQRLMFHRPNSRGCMMMGCSLLCVALISLLKVYGVGTAVFMLLTLLMSVWTLLPVGLAVLKQGRKMP